MGWRRRDPKVERLNPNFDVKDVKRALKDFAELQVSLQPPFEYLNSAKWVCTLLNQALYIVEKENLAF